MNPVLIARRAVECGCVVGLYTAIEKSHSFYKFKVDDAHSQNLNKFRKNIAEEAAEVLTKLNQNLYAELEKIHRQSKSREDISVWVHQLLGDEGLVPPKLNKIKKHTSINDQQRVIPLDQQEGCIRLAKHSERFKNNSEAALRHVLNEFGDLQNEVIIVFTTKQKQVSKVIESYRTKHFTEIPTRAYDKMQAIFQMFGCLMLSETFRRQWPLAPAQLMAHEKKIPKYGKTLFGSLLVLAYYISEDDKEVNDYHLDTAYEEAHVPMPQFPRLPPQQFSGITPVVYKPEQTVEDRFPTEFIESKVGNAFTDGFVFRRLLFGSLMLFSSSWTSHLLTAAAASVAECLQETTEESYHPVTVDEQTRVYVAESGLAHNVSFSIPLKPLLLQAMLFASGRWYLTAAVDLLMRLKEVKREAMWDDDFWVLFRSSDVYGLACRAVAFIDWVSSPLVHLLDKLPGERTRHEQISGKILERYGNLSKDSGIGSEGKGEDLTTEEMVALEKAMMHFSYTMHLPLQSLIPKPFDAKASKWESSHGPGESQLLQRLSGVDNDSLARVHAFLEDSERSYLNNYFGGKVARKDVNIMLRQCITDSTWGEADRGGGDLDDAYVKRVFFWDIEATEENVLDLLQEFYEFISAKRILYAEDFIYVQGRAHMMDLECEPQVTEALMQDYYKRLDRWLLQAMALEEINFLNRYGLTKPHVESIVARWTSTKELNDTWKKYFDAKEYQDLVKKKADPVPVYRAKEPALPEVNQ
jgi:hypothetical protein